MDTKEIKLAHNGMLPKWGNTDYQSTRFMLVFAGLMMVIFGFIMIPDQIQGIGSWILQALMMVSGMYFVFCSIFWMRSDSKYAPKVILDESELKIRHNFFEPFRTYKWNDLQQVDIKDDRLDLTSARGHDAIPLEPKMKHGLELKESLKYFCEQKQVAFVD